MINLNSTEISTNAEKISTTDANLDLKANLGDLEALSSDVDNKLGLKVDTTSLSEYAASTNTTLESLASTFVSTNTTMVQTINQLQTVVSTKAEANQLNNYTLKTDPIFNMSDIANSLTFKEVVNTYSPAGNDGTDGIDGVDGNNGSDGIDGNNGSDGIDGNNGIEGPRGYTGQRGAAGEAGEDGKDSTTQGPRGYTGQRGARGAQGNNAGPNPTFDNVTVNGTFNCGNSLKNNGYTTLRSNGIQLNYFDREIPEIGRKFTGIIVLSALGNDKSSGVFSVANNSYSVGGVIKTLSIQSDYSDGKRNVGLKYVNGELKATKYNTGNYERYAVSFFGYH